MQNPDRAMFLAKTKSVLLFLLFMMTLQGCQGGVPQDVSIEISLQRRIGGQPYLLLSEEKKTRVINLNGFYEMEDLIPDLALEKEFTVAGNMYIVTSLFGQVPATGFNSPRKKLYEYYLEIYDSGRELVDLNYLHRDEENDWSVIFDKNFSQLNQEEYCLLTFKDSVSGVECLVRGNYNIFCRSGEKTGEEEGQQAIAITTARLMVGNREYLEGGRVLAGTVGGNYLLIAKVVDWNLDGHFDQHDRVVFPNLAAEQYYPFGEKLELPFIDLLASPYEGQISKRRYVLKLSSSSKEGETPEYTLRIQSRR